MWGVYIALAVFIIGMGWRVYEWTSTPKSPVRLGLFPKPATSLGRVGRMLTDTFVAPQSFAIAGLIPGLVGMIFAASYPLLLVSSFVFGFCLLSAGPIGFQYAAEITHPAPEGTSNTLLLVMGQISGILFIFGMDMLKAPATGAMTGPLLALTALTAGCIALAVALPESPIRDGTPGR